MWFGANMMVHGTMARNLKSPDKTIRKSYATTIRNFNLRYMLPGLLVSVITGVWMIVDHYGMKAPYIHAKVTFGILAAILTLVSFPAFNRVVAGAEQADPESADWKKTVLKWRIMTMVVSLLLLLTLISALLKFG